MSDMWTVARHRWLAACLAVATPIFAHAGPPMGGPEGHPGPPPGMPGELFFGDHPPPYLRGIKLTEEQQDKVFTIMHTAEPALREQAKAAHKAREALRELGHSAQFDNGNASSLATALGKAESQMALLMTRTDHDIFALLTAEQRTAIAQHEHEHEHEHDAEHAEHDHGHDGSSPR